MHLTALRDLVHRPGPFVTVRADVGRTTEDAPQQLDARWTTIRHALEHASAASGLIARFDERLHERPAAAGPLRRTLVGEADEIVFDDVQAGETSWTEGVDVAPLPDLAGWVARADRDIPFALVVADRKGADIEFHRGLAVPIFDEETVEGEDFQITKVPEGDWAQAQYQRSAENVWKETAEEVAEAVRSGIQRHRPRLVVLAGDVRARGLIEDALAGVGVPLILTDAGGRAAGSSDQALWDDVRRILAETEAHDEIDVVDRLKADQGRGAAHGLDEVVDALVRGQVDRLVVDLETAR